jgi:hypothetical protein
LLQASKSTTGGGEKDLPLKSHAATVTVRDVCLDPAELVRAHIN